MRHHRYSAPQAPAKERAPAFLVASGLGGSFTVSIVEQIDAETVQVRVHYPSADWDGYTFRAKRSALREHGHVMVERKRAA